MKTGFACGVFDVFHIGHVLMLKECKEHCDYLVVAVNRASCFDSSINPDKKKPIFPVEVRKEVLQSCRYVDEVIEYEGEAELLELLGSEKFAIRFLGDDYRDKPVTGAELNMEIHYIDRSHGWSTSRLKRMLQDDGF